MYWDFTPEQVITGEFPYSLKDFRQDLWEEVREYTNHAGYEALFWAIYHLAMGYSPLEMAGMIQRQNNLSPEETREQLRRFEMIADVHQESIDMLKAIIKRQLIRYKEESSEFQRNRPVTEYIKEWIEGAINDHEFD